jgi:c-di-AMP phosphodiesterase-like protein
MNHKLRQYGAIVLLLALLTVITLLTWFFDQRLFFASLGFRRGVVVVALRLGGLRRELSIYVETLGNALSNYQRKSLEQFPLPMLVADTAGEILWYNSRLKRAILPDHEDLFGHNWRNFLARCAFPSPARMRATTTV